MIDIGTPPGVAAIRASLRLAAKQHHPAVMSALRAIYTAPTEQAAEHALQTSLPRSWVSVTRPPYAPGARVERVHALPGLPARDTEGRVNRGHFPSEQAALKVLYLAVRELITPKARDVNHVAAHWKMALNRFSLSFEDRLNTT